MLFLQLLVNGIFSGSVYALLGLSFATIFAKSGPKIAKTRPKNSSKAKKIPTKWTTTLRKTTKNTARSAKS